MGLDNRLAQVQELVVLASDTSQESRSALVAAIAGLYSGSGPTLSAEERMMMADIIQRLIHDVEVSVRSALAKRFAGMPDAPRELVVTLASDEIEVACPLLIKSEVLRDAELIEILEQRAMEHQLAVAMRQYLSPRLSDVLVATENEKVVTALLSNDGAEISERTMSDLVERSRDVDGYRAPLSRRSDLTPQMAKRLCLWVSDALRARIVKDFDIDPRELDDAIQGAVADAVAGKANEQDPPALELAGSRKGESGNGRSLIKLLERGEIGYFLDTFVKHSKLPLSVVRKLVFEPGGEALAIVCKSIGVDKAAFAKILILCRQGRLGDQQVQSDEVTRAVSFYDQATPETAQVVMQRWRGDPASLKELKQVYEFDELGLS